MKDTLDVRQASQLASMMLGRAMPVVIGDFDTAYTDNNRILLPFCTGDKAMTLQRGYIDHEVGHGAHTDFSVPFPTGLGEPLMQILEDVRQERLQGLQYPGCRLNLRNMTQALTEDPESNLMHAQQADDPPAQILTAYVLQRLRVDILEQTPLADNAALTEKAFESVFPEGAVSRTNALIYQVERCDATADVRELALELMRNLEEAAREEPPPSEPGDGQAGEGSDAGQDDNGSGSPGAPAAGDDDGNSPADGQPSPDGDDGQTSGDDSNAAAGDTGDLDSSKSCAGSSDGVGGNASPDGQDDARTAAARDALRKALEGDDAIEADVGAMAANAIAKEKADEATAPGERMEPFVAGPAEPEQHSPMVLYDLQEARSQSTALRVHMARLIEANNVEPRFNSRRGRKLDSRRLAHLASGGTRVFVHRDMTRDVNTAVQVLMDRSISMNRSMDLAMQATFATGLAVEGIRNARVAASAFPSANQGIVPLTHFGERVETTRDRYAIQASGGTPMAEAMGAAILTLMNEPEERRILLVVTDGEPNSAPAVESMVRHARALGIEVLGLGIGTMKVESLFPVSRVITDIGDLATSMIEMLREQLLGRAA